MYIDRKKREYLSDYIMLVCLVAAALTDYVWTSIRHRIIRGR